MIWEIIEDSVDFDEDLTFSNSIEITKRNHHIIALNFDLKKVDFIEQEAIKGKTDCIIQLRNGKKIKLEFKNYRKGSSNSVVLEIYHDIKDSWRENEITEKNGKFGWTFYLKRNDIDYVIFTSHGKKKLCYLILKAKELEEWWRNNIYNYKDSWRENKVTEKNGKFRNQSSYCYVPIKDFPKDMIYNQKIFCDLNDFFEVG